MTRDLRTLIYLLNLELREECSRTFGPGMGWNPASAIGEQQSKQTQSGSSSRSGCDREQQLKRMQAASSRRNRGAAAEAKGGQQLKWTPQSGPGAAAEADAIGEQLCSLHRELSGAGLRTVGERGEVAEQAKRAQLLVYS